ncbi:MAG: DUF3857 domain-containing protein, partial [Bacteroidales bacterium]|nr:DUF3857 domain-containing protein [Bacteroidales bacterium]
MKLRKLTLALTVLLSATVFAGKDKIKFGKIPVEDVKMAVYEADSNAEAVFLHDEGQTYFIFEGSFFKMIYERHFRIKILSNEGLHWADIEIPYYVGSGGTEEEDVYQIKAVTHNYEDGEVVTEKFDKKDIYKEKASKYYKQIRFAMPKVKVGSVIEVTYTKKSDNFSLLSDWQFQYTIPVRHSEYTVKTPEYFIYKESMGGYLRYNRGTKSSSGKIGELHYSVDERHYSMDNIPAFNVEPMCSNPYNYVSQVSFELEYFNGTDFNYYKDFSSSWAEVIDDMLEAEGMGKEMQKNPGFIKDQANVIKLAAKSDVEKIQMAYEWVKSKIMWNGVNGDYKQHGINKAFKEGKGNTADVNFTLISLLRNCGFITHPVVLSTRKNGIIRPGQVTAMKFNYVICYVELGDNYLLLDATDKYCPLNILPKRCLNGKGRIVSATKNEWVDLKSHVPSKETKMYNIKLTA